MPPIDKRQLLKKQEEDHICIRIFKDDTVLITDSHGNPLDPVKDPKSLVGPSNTYYQALWYNQNPTCIWFGGRQY